MASAIVIALVFAASILCCHIFAERRDGNPVFWGVTGAIFGPLAIPFVFISTARGQKMRNNRMLLFTGIIFTITACSGESLKRTGYETLRNVQKQQCQKERSSECPKSESYDVYQKKMKDLETTR